MENSKIISLQTVDLEDAVSYSLSMIKTRKKRSDRKHIVYVLTVAGKSYVGVTYVHDNDPKKSLRRRWQKHVRRALTENRNWKLCVAIRKYGKDKFSTDIVKVVRGKATAHEVERTLIRSLKPKLNTDDR